MLTLWLSQLLLARSSEHLLHIEYDETFIANFDQILKREMVIVLRNVGFILQWMASSNGKMSYFSL